MASPDRDVFICWDEPSGEELARTVAAGLARRGFRVYFEPRPPGPPPDPDRLALIEQIPDFVLVTPPPGDRGLDPRLHTEVARALQAGRNVVRVEDAALVPADLPPDLAPLAAVHTVACDRERPGESIARLAHCLSSEGTVDDRRVMRRARRLFLLAGLLLLGGIALQEVPALLERWSRPRLRDPVPPFALYWSAAGQRLEAGRWVRFPVTDAAAVRPGDRIRLTFSTSADGYAYVVSRTAGGEVAVLFPPASVRRASRVEAGQQQVAPVGSGWLDLDEASMPEAIYLIAGYDAQQNLEELIEEEGAAGAASRRALLEATVAGLLDGRHGAAERGVRTGSLHPIGQDLRIPDVERRVSIALASGEVIEAELAIQPGVVSACVELRLARAPTP